MTAGRVISGEPQSPTTKTLPAHGGPGPPPAQGDGEGGGDWTLLTTAADSVVAHLIQGRLSEEQIPCVLDDFNPSPGAWLKPFGDPLAPVRVFVPRRALGPASILLHEIGHQPPDPLSEGPRIVKGLWLVTIVMIVIVSVVFLLKVYLGQPVWF